MKLAIRTLLLAVTASLSLSALAATAGRVLASAGQVNIVRGGQNLPAGTGAIIETGDTVTAGNASNAQLRMLDGALIAIRPNTVLRIDDYRFEQGGDKQNNSAAVNLLRGGLPWRMLPPCFPPVSTVRRWFYLWRDNRLWLSLNHALLLIAREGTGREASPSAGVIDSQSVKTTESGGPRGYDAGKKTKGRKRHILTDTDGNLVHAVVHTADIQDRDGAPLVLAQIIKRFPWLRHVFADGGYAGDKLREALRRIGKWTVEIVKRSDAAKGFVVLPRRWVVERTLAWLNRNRRLARDFEQTIASATAWLFIASIQLFARRIARPWNHNG